MLQNFSNYIRNLQTNKDMQETWKRFVYPLIEDKKQDVEEESYHRHIENQLMLLGWEPWKGELYTEKTFLIAFVRIS